MQIQFTASQSVELLVPKQPIPIEHYLRQPYRLINALIDPSRVDALSGDTFRLKMRPLNFLTLSIQPTVDMQIWAETDGTIHLRSLECEIRGIEYINERFDLNLLGKLAPTQTKKGTCLLGRADLQVEVGLPPAFWLTPRPLLEAAGNGVLRSVLLTIKQRLMHQLLSDYCHWATMQISEAAEATEAGRSPLSLVTE